LRDDFKVNIFGKRNYENGNWVKKVVQAPPGTKKVPHLSTEDFF
jgi:hypothetical protein